MGTTSTMHTFHKMDRNALMNEMSTSRSINGNTVGTITAVTKLERKV